jgi:uncharacterized protein (TIGR02996 family)
MVVRELLDAIYADLTDDDARQVYGDYLSERGDPRGELIALQLAPSERTAAREQALIAAHGAEWLGALAPIALPGLARFTRGFVSGITLVIVAAPVLRATIGVREWLTVEQLDLRYQPASELLRHPSTYGLRDLARVPGALACELATGPERPIERLGVDDELPFPEALADAPSLPELTSLVFAHDPDRDLFEFLDALVGGALGARLRELTVLTSNVWSLPDCLRRVEKLPALERFRVGLFVFERDGSSFRKATVGLRSSGDVRRACRELGTLRAGSLREILVETPPDLERYDLDLLRRALRRFKRAVHTIV